MTDDTPAKWKAIGEAYHVFLKTLIAENKMTTKDILDFAIINFGSFPSLMTTDEDKKREIFAAAMIDVRTAEAKRFGDLRPDACIHERMSYHISSSIADGVAGDTGGEITPADQIHSIIEGVNAFIWAISSPATAIGNAMAVGDGLAHNMRELKEGFEEEDSRSETILNPTLQ